MTDNSWMDETPSCPDPEAHALSPEDLQKVVESLAGECSYLPKGDGQSMGLFQRGPSLW